MFFSSRENFQICVTDPLTSLRYAVKNTKGYIFICRRDIDGFTTNLPGLREFLMGQFLSSNLLTLITSRRYPDKNIIVVHFNNEQWVIFRDNDIIRMMDAMEHGMAYSGNELWSFLRACAMMSMYKAMISDASYRAKEELPRRRHYFSIDSNTSTTNRGIPLHL